MADSPSNGLKRPHPDDLENGGSAQKKLRSPAPQSNGTTTSKPDVSKIMEDARKRAAAIASRMGAGKPAASPSPAPQVAGDTGGMSRAEILKSRVAAAMAKTSNAIDQRTASPIYQAPSMEDGISRARGGLGIGLHPSLMETGQGASKNKQAIQPKFATTMANRRSESAADLTPKPGKAKKQLDLSAPSAEEYRQNPYFDASLGGQTATLRKREPKSLQFNAKGKYVQLGAALRRLNALEELKKRVALNSKKAGLHEDPTEKNFKIEEPPDQFVEWWDESLLSGKGYNDLDSAKIETEDSTITRFVQHPVLIEPPSLKFMPAPKPLPLTSKEQAKLRRITRMSALKEQQAKERLGLVPTPAPKVKLGNMMRVLGEEAVKDPTAVEARVNKEIAQRKTTHEQMNESRKLTKEEKHEKLDVKKAQDAAKGIHVKVFKINSLASGRHRFKIGKTAEQLGLTGICLSGPKQNLCIVEGGTKGVGDYRKLMMNRIQWSENDIPPVREGNKVAKEQWLQALDEEGNLKDLSDNRCEVVWEGETASRAFTTFRFKTIETDVEAINTLKRAKMETFWTQAKSIL